MSGRATASAAGSDTGDAALTGAGTSGRLHGIVRRSNDRIALRMTIAFGSIWCVYAFILFSLVPLLLPRAQDTLLYVSNCIQLVALPAIMVGSALLAKGSDERSAQDHAALVEILADVREELASLRLLTAALPGAAVDPPAAGVAPAPRATGDQIA